MEINIPPPSTYATELSAASTSLEHYSVKKYTFHVYESIIIDEENSNALLKRASKETEAREGFCLSCLGMRSVF